MNKVLKKILIILSILIILGICLIFGINAYVKKSVNENIIEISNIKENYDAILVLGAGLKNGKPSPVLKDRLDTAYEAYIKGASSKIIVSGDHGRKTYDEVNVMKDYLISKGVPSDNIFMDHAGFSTYDTIYRAKEIFLCNKVLIVTQEFHIFRSLYIAKKLDLEAEGVSATLRHYSGETKFELREILARDKDFVKTIFKPKPKYLGDTIPVFGNGDITNDKNVLEKN